jgi:iron complex outermembrane receptor protein
MRMSKVVMVAVVASALLLWRPVSAAAQAADLVGRVLDPQGGAVQGATVRVSRAAGGSADLVAVSAADGRFHISGVTPGRVIVQVDRGGFRRLVQPLTLADGRLTLTFTLDLEGIDEAVVVTAAGMPQALRETSKAVTTFEQSDIRARQQFSIADVVRTAPGVQVRDNGGPGQLGSMRIRGLRPDAAAVLVDGFRMRDAASTQADATAFFSNLAVTATDRVEVLRGSGSSLYGTNAVGGVLNMVSLAGGGPLGGDVEIEYGSLGQTRARGSVAGSALNERLAFSAGALGWDTADGLDGDDAARSTGAHGTMRMRFNPATSFWVRYLGSSDRVRTNASPTTFGIPAANIPDQTVVEAVAVPSDQMERFNDGLPVDIGAATFFPGQNDPDADRRSSLQAIALRLERQQTSSVLWQASYQRLHTARTHANGPLGPGFQSATESVSEFAGDIDTLELRGTAQWRSWLSVTGGYEFERESYFEHLDDNAPAPDRLITESEVSQTGHTLFGALNAAFDDRRLQISLSGRFQGFRFSTPTFSTVGTANPYEGLDLDAPPSALTGDVSVAYFVTSSNTKVRAHAGNAYRAPALYERFGGGFFADPATRVIIFSPFGDPRLAPDRYRTVDAGVDQYFWGDRAIASATVFGIDVRSQTQFDFSGAIDPATDPFGRFFGYVNGSGGSSTGVELSLDARPRRGLSVRASYAHTDADTDEDLAVEGFFKSPAVFGDTAALVVNHAWRQRVITVVEVFHASSSYTALFANGRSRAFKFPGFTTVGLTSSVRIGDSQAVPVRAYLRLDNLFNDEYYLGGWRAPGRTAAVGMSLAF